MSDMPFPLTAQTLQEVIRQTQKLFDDLYQDRIGGALVGDVLEIDTADILCLKVAASGGLEKSSSELQVKNHVTGGLMSNVSGESIKCKTAGGLATDSGGLYATSALYSFGFIDVPAGTDPAADSGADTLILANGANIAITGEATTDTVTIAVSGFKGYREGLQVSIKDSANLYVSGGEIEINGAYYSATSQLTVALGTIVVSTLYYIYVTPPAAGTTLVAAQFSVSSTAPTFDNAKGADYKTGDGTKRYVARYYEE